MKMYNNGQRPQKMYGGGMAMPRKPMMMGGTAMKNKNTQMSSMMEKNIKPNQTNMMGMNLGGAIKKFEKKSNGGKTGAKPDYLDFDKDGNTKESMKQALKQKKSGKKAT